VRKVIVAALFLAGIVGAYWAVMEYGLRWTSARSYSSDSPLPERAEAALDGGQKVVFLELGSVGCRSCEAMKPVLAAVRKRYPNQVDVILYDVKKNPATAAEYGVRLIPTQVFLLPDGTEFFRHEGYFSEGEIVAVLRRMGVR
jgi:thioredoxin 1